MANSAENEITRLSRLITQFVRNQPNYRARQVVADLFVIAGIHAISVDMCCQEFAAVAHDGYHEAEEQVAHADKQPLKDPHAH